jgi:hypothetical protein
MQHGMMHLPLLLNMYTNQIIVRSRLDLPVFHAREFSCRPRYGILHTITRRGTVLILLVSFFDEIVDLAVRREFPVLL